MIHIQRATSAVTADPCRPVSYITARILYEFCNNFLRSHAPSRHDLGKPSRFVSRILQLIEMDFIANRYGDSDHRISVRPEWTDRWPVFSAVESLWNSRKWRGNTFWVWHTIHCNVTQRSGTEEKYDCCVWPWSFFGVTADATSELHSVFRSNYIDGPPFPYAEKKIKIDGDDTAEIDRARCNYYMRVVWKLFILSSICRNEPETRWGKGIGPDTEVFDAFCRSESRKEEEEEEKRVVIIIRAVFVTEEVFPTV